MDLSIDGKDIGRLDFELFGQSSPKTVNTFLGFVSGDYDPYMRYKGTYFTRIFEQRFMQGGDFISQDGKGSATVYPGKERMRSERNKLKFSEPYLLAMASDSDGNTGSQFFITLDDAPMLNDSSHTIIGRLKKGKEVLDICVGMEQFRRDRPLLEYRIKNLPMSLGAAMVDEKTEAQLKAQRL